MRLENDDIFNCIYDDEFEKIPFLFRFGKKRAKAVIISLCVSFGLMLISTTVFLSTRELTEAPSLPGYEPIAFYSFNPVATGFMIIVTLMTILLGIWIVLSQWFERRAFKKASELSNKIYISERHKAELKWQEWKAQNRFD